MWSGIFCSVLRSGSGQGPISPEVNRQHGHQVISGLEENIRQVKNDHSLQLNDKAFCLVPWQDKVLGWKN